MSSTSSNTFALQCFNPVGALAPITTQRDQTMLDDIQKLWAIGLSVNEIAKKIGVTKGVISGMIHRAKKEGVVFSPRKSGIVRKRSVSKTVDKKPKPTSNIVKLRHDSCRYILNSDMTAPIFCSNVIHHRSYCEEHARLCYIPIVRKAK